MKRAVFILTLSLLYLQIIAQKGELGVAGGISYYIGDLNPYGHFKELNPMGGVTYRYNFNSRYNFRANILYGFVSGDDANSSDPVQKSRNLNFTSDIVELAGIMELNFYDFHRTNSDYPYSSYMFVGFNFFKMNPKTSFDDEYVELQPLGTEGQGTSLDQKFKKYKRIQIGIPFGLGIKFKINKKVVISVEYGLRKIFTDYLDDVSGLYADPTILITENGSLAELLAMRGDPDLIGNNESHTGLQRGNSSTKDWYSFTGISISYRMGKVACQKVGDR